MKPGYLVKNVSDMEIFDIFDSIFLLFDENGELVKANQALKRYFPHINEIEYRDITEILCFEFFVKEYEIDKKKVVIAIEPVNFIRTFMPEFFADIIHKLENPISGVLGFLGLMKLNRDDPEKFIEYTVKAESGVKKIEELIKSLYPFTKQSSPNFNKGDFAAYFRSITKQIADNPRWKIRNILFSAESPRGSIWTSFDPVNFKIAIENFVYFIEKKLVKGDEIELELKKGVKRFSILFNIKTDKVIRDIFMSDGHKSLDLLIALKIIREHRGMVMLDKDVLSGKSVEVQFLIF